MASGKVDSGRYSSSDSPVRYGFTKSFSASAQTNISAGTASYEVPEGYVGVLAGYNTTTSVLLIDAIDPNTSNILCIRNISSSAQNNKSCVFRVTFIRSEMIQDERNL